MKAGVAAALATPSANVTVRYSAAAAATPAGVVASVVLVLYDYDTDFALLKAALGDLPAWLEGANISGHINHVGWARDGLEESPTAHHALHDALELRAGWIASRKYEAARG